MTGSIEEGGSDHHPHDSKSAEFTFLLSKINEIHDTIREELRSPGFVKKVAEQLEASQALEIVLSPIVGKLLPTDVKKSRDYNALSARKVAIRVRTPNSISEIIDPKNAFWIIQISNNHPFQYGRQQVASFELINVSSMTPRFLSADSDRRSLYFKRTDVNVDGTEFPDDWFDAHTVVAPFAKNVYSLIEFTFEHPNTRINTYSIV